jgi:hypothetical protein
MRRRRHLLSIAAAGGLAAVAFGAGLPFSRGFVTASAQSNCTDNNNCAWTQIENGNWQPGQNQNPDCGTACDEWGPDCSSTLTYFNPWSGQNNPWEHEVDWAQNMWNSVQECTPTFRKASSGQVTYGATSQTRGTCAITNNSGYQSGNVRVITSSAINFNNSVPNYDGPPPSTAPWYSCNIKTGALHETGHSYGEGHSSILSDIMYPVQRGAVTIDADAHHMLAAVYGYASGSGCNSCQYNIANFGAPPIRQMGPTYFAQSVVNKATGAAGVATSSAAGATDTANNGEQDAVGGYLAAKECENAYVVYNDPSQCPSPLTGPPTQ